MRLLAVATAVAVAVALGIALGGCNYMRHPTDTTTWGKPEGRTRRAHKPSDRLISRRRGRNKR